MAIDMFKGDGDGELVFQDADGSDEVGVLDSRRDFLPITLSMAYTAAVVASKAYRSLRYVVKGAKSQETQKHCVLSL
jgi:hypothetical protein